MGFPFIGEILSLIIPSYSLDLHPFIKTRLQRCGPIFRTNIVGRPVAISADKEFNNFLIQQEGRLVELYYLDTFLKIFGHEGESRTNAFGQTHKCTRRTFLNHFGAERLKEMLIPEIEQTINKTQSAWSTQASVEVKHAASVLVLYFNAKQMINYDAKKSPESLIEAYTRIIQGFMSFPLNIPGTAYNQYLKDKEKIIAMLRDMLKERRGFPGMNRGDFLDQINKDMDKEKFLSEDFIVQLIFGVINESIRLVNVAPGLLRRALKDIPVKGFTIPKGWAIMMVTSALWMSPSTFHNPGEFNPRRWKDLDSNVISKNFMPFGGGMKQCAGFMATFFHVLLTKYRWTKIKEGNIVRNPILGFGKGIHIKFLEKN